MPLSKLVADDVDTLSLMPHASASASDADADGKGRQLGVAIGIGATFRAADPRAFRLFAVAISRDATRVGRASIGVKRLWINDSFRFDR